MRIVGQNYAGGFPIGPIIIGIHFKYMLVFPESGLEFTTRVQYVGIAVMEFRLVWRFLNGFFIMFSRLRINLFGFGVLPHQEFREIGIGVNSLDCVQSGHRQASV